MASELILIRHGETEWSKNGRHTSTTDLPLTPPGVAASKALAQYLADVDIDHSFSSPRQRARVTAEHALGDRASMLEITEDLAEWNYGDYEGLTSPQIRKSSPGWDLWTQGCPGGEKPGDVEARLTRLFERIDNLSGTVVCFAHGHILRAFGSLWISGEVVLGGRLRLGTAAVSVLGYEHGKPAIVRWNFEASVA
jgi:broad specificity phosphatase PhoE